MTSKNVGAVHGERTAAHRAGNDAREVEHFYAGERPLRGAELLDWRLADLLDGQQRKLGDRLTLRMLVPLGERAARRDDEAGFGRRGLQRLGGHAIERALHRGLVVSNAEQFEEAAAMVRQIGMQPREAAVAAAIKSGEVVVIFVRHSAVDAQISFAAKFDGRAAHVDAHALPAPGAQPPQFGGRQRRRADRRRRRRSHRE